jgi:lipoprotein-anchoring transpeptidase ErfK/SrfK
VQRKSNINDQSFQPIGFVPSNAPSGNSSQEIQYWFQDPSPLPGTGLYRLKQIDHSGKFSYSPIRTVSAKQLLSQILPNPADEQATLIFSGKQRTYQVEWINALGQRLGVWIGRDQLTIPTRSFSNGIHRIKISDKQTGQSETRTLLIQHTQ